MIRLFLALAATIGFGLLLASCNTLSKEECVAADWRVIGENDGATGYEPQQRFAAHAKSCERVKIVPDQTIEYSPNALFRGLKALQVAPNGLS